MKTKILNVIAAFVLSLIARAEQVVIQPGPQDGQDMWMSSVYARKAVDDQKLNVGGWGDYYLSFIKFNIVNQPKNVVAADMWLYCPAGITSQGQTSMIAYLLTTSWNEKTTTLNDSLQGYNLGNVPAPTPGNWYGLGIKSIYEYWQNGQIPNNGFCFLPNVINNKWNIFWSSDYWDTKYRPKLVLTYIKLKYPLANATKPNVGGYRFGVLWKENGNNGYASDNKTKFLHTGLDLVAKAGDAVCATSDGWIRYANVDSKWGGYVVLEHTLENGQKYTTSYIHVIPTLYGSFPVSKGQKIATVAYGNIYYNPHLHFQVRLNGYDTSNNVSDRRGALPEKAIDGFLAFPEYFIDPSIKVVWE